MVLEEVKDEIRKMQRAEKSYREIGERYGVNKGVIWMVLNRNYEPKRRDIRRKLGLEDITVDFIKQVRGPNGKFVKETDNGHS